ncbi:CDC27 family protein, partial [Myxococcota bacterium]|nr:CDC27 family protein [Myxococcota bacterium]
MVKPDGHLTYLHAVEKGEPKIVSLGKEKELTRQIFEAYNTAGDDPRGYVSCGAPRFGTLTVTQPSGETRHHDLYDRKALYKYSRLARIFERRLQPLSPLSPWGDCLSLDVPPKIEILKSPSSYATWFPTAPMHSPSEDFFSYVDASSDEARARALDKVVRIKGSDPFFARYLVTTFPYSLSAREILTYHSALVALTITRGREAGVVIKKLARGRNLEHKYFLTLLYLLRYEFPKAASACRSYFSGLGRHKEGEREAAQILKAQEAMGQLNFGESSWSRQIHTVGFLFEFWHTWAQRLEAPHQRSFPLARSFYYRAFHFARMYAGDLKVGNIPSTPLGRAFLKQFLPVIARSLWWTLPPFIQNDIVQTITAFRALPKYFGGIKEVEPLIPPLAKRIWELGRMRRYRAAQELMQKYERKGTPASMKYALGKALFEMERWDEALSYLREAQDSGAGDVTRLMVLASFQRGKADLNEPPAEMDESLGRLEWFVSNGLFSLGSELVKTLTTAKLSSRGRLIVTKLRLALGLPGAMAALEKLASGNDETALTSRILLGELHLAAGATFTKVYDTIARSLYGSHSARAFAILAAAGRAKGQENGRVFAEKGAQSARDNPEQWLGYLDILIRYGVYPELSYRGSQEALAHFQRSSHLAWLRAVLFLRSGMHQLASNEIERALLVQPYNEKYKNLKKLILEN